MKTPVVPAAKITNP